MPLDHAFRFSVYLTLGLACACLGYAEWPFLPEAAVLAGVVGLLLVAAFRAEGRFALSEGRANAVGIGITVLAVVYYIVRAFLPGGPGEILPFPASLLPFLGPLLMVLIPAKLIRPKGDDDYWALLALGLSAVALACALAVDALFAALLVLYMGSGVWTLALFCRLRGRRAAPRPALFRPAVGWTVLALAAAAGLFLLTPRFGEARWELPYSHRYHLQTGYRSEQPGIDLNRTGTQETSQEVVFTVMAQDRQGQPVHLDAVQRWRGEVLCYYENGRLLNHLQALNRVQRRRTLTPPSRPDVQVTFPGSPAVGQPGTVVGQPAPAELKRPEVVGVMIAPWQPPPRAPRTGTLPDLGSEQVTLTYTLNRSAGQGFFLADPLVFGVDRSVPVVSLGHDKTFLWELLEDGQPVPVISFRNDANQYRQVTVPWTEGTPGPPVLVNRKYYEQLCEAPNLPRLKEWTEDRLAELTAGGILPVSATRPEHRDATGAPLPPYHGMIARAFSQYLAEHYTYTLTLERRRPDVDPVEEFLFETREGNCERFAAALMLMLRSLRIPCQVVLGFQGCEDLGDGAHEVRQSQAHGWVEVLLLGPDGPGEQGPITGRWLPLDPTPTGGPLPQEESLLSRWERFSSWFHDFVVNFGGEQREKALAAVADWFRSAGQSLYDEATGPHKGRFFAIIAALVAGLISGVWAWRRWRRFLSTGSRGPALVDFQARLLVMLARAGFCPADGQTPREFAAVVAEALGTRVGLAEFAGVPVAITSEYYRYRFGGEALSEEERSVICARLDGLAAALATRPARV